MVVYGIEIDMGKNYSEQLQNLGGSDDIISTSDVNVIFKYPLRDSLTLTVRPNNTGIITKKDIVMAIHKHFSEIYDECDKFGLHCYSIDDIRLEAISVKNNEIKLLLG